MIEVAKNSKLLRTVDLFCGAGGSTSGATAAGLNVVAAINHWKLAVSTHASNHPLTVHYCQDAGLMDPTKLPAVDVLLASPECRGHAKARGKERPHHDGSRATAWCVVNFAETLRPRAIVVENVPDFRQWSLYPQWQTCLRMLGYQLTENVLDAADFGVPQNRVRMFIVGMLRQPTLRIESPNLPHVPIASVIDMESASWSPVKGHAERTLARIKTARKRFGRRFVMPYYGSGSGETGRSLDRPLGTVTTRDRWAIVDGDRMRMLTPREYQRAMGFEPSYQVNGTRAEKIHQLGNAVCPPVMRHICRAIGEACNS